MKYICVAVLVTITYCFMVLNIFVGRNIIMDNFSAEKSWNFTIDPNSTSTINSEFNVEFRVNSTVAMLYIMSYFLMLYSILLMCKVTYLATLLVQDDYPELIFSAVVITTGIKIMNLILLVILFHRNFINDLERIANYSTYLITVTTVMYLDIPLYILYIALNYGCYRLDRYINERNRNRTISRNFQSQPSQTETGTV